MIPLLTKERPMSKQNNQNVETVEDFILEEDASAGHEVMV